MGPNFLALTPPGNQNKKKQPPDNSRRGIPKSIPARPEFRALSLTVQAGVVVVDGLDDAAEVELDVPLDEAGVEGTEVPPLVVDAAGGGGDTRRGRGTAFPREFRRESPPGISPEGGDLVLGKVLVALEAVLVGVEDGQALVRQHLRLLQLHFGGGNPPKKFGINGCSRFS